MNYTKGNWKAYCMGSEGYQVRRDNDGIPAAKIKEDLKERLTPIVESMGGSFETQKANAHLISAAPEMYEALKVIMVRFARAVATMPADKDRDAYDLSLKAICKAEGR